MKKQGKSYIKIGDKIKIISGNQKGLIGTITTILKKKSIVFVEGVLPRIKYVKNKQQEGGEPTKIEIPLGIHASNVMLWDSTSNACSRIFYKRINAKKERYFKKSGNLV